jgi:CDP-diglyceride synthetase
MQLQLGPVSILLPAVYLLITGIRIAPREKVGLVQTTSVLLLMTVGYFFVYVVTPRDLHYHLMTSLNRLFLQLWPGVLFVVFMIARPLRASWPGKGPESAPPPSKQRQRQRRKTKIKEAK